MACGRAGAEECCPSGHLGSREKGKELQRETYPSRSNNPMTSLPTRSCVLKVLPMDTWGSWGTSRYKLQHLLYLEVKASLKATWDYTRKEHLTHTNLGKIRDLMLHSSIAEIRPESGQKRNFPYLVCHHSHHPLPFLPMLTCRRAYISQEALTCDLKRGPVV